MDKPGETRRAVDQDDGRLSFRVNCLKDRHHEIWNESLIVDRGTA